MQLTEKQCALLSGFMYLNQSVNKKEKKGKPIGKIIKDLKDENEQINKDLLDPTGGITKEEAVEFLKEIEQDPVLRNLKPVHSVDTGIRATCFVDSKSNDKADAIVAFRGTGGITRAWEDNLVGAYEPVTAMQQEAVDFVRDTCSDCMISQVTGHSKGGNLAMHVTIASGRIIDDCVSFDGQGFNTFYLEDNKDLIEKNAKNIKCINADKDFVSPLLYTVVPPENTKCIKIGDVENFSDSHKLTMLTNENLFDSNGQYKLEVIGDRTMLSNQINNITTGLDKVGFYDWGKGLVDWVAVEIGAAMTKEPERELAQKRESKDSELSAIKSGEFHVEKEKKDEEKDRVRAESRDLKKLKLSRKKYHLTADQIESIKAKKNFFNRDKVEISKKDLELLKTEALEACELSENVNKAQNIIESANEKAALIVSRATDKSSGIQEEIAKVQLKRVKKENPQHFQNGLYVGTKSKNEQQAPKEKKSSDTRLKNTIKYAFEKVSKNHLSAEHINSISGRQSILDKETVTIPRKDFESLKNGALLSVELLRSDISPQEMVKSAKTEADRIVTGAKNKASGIEEKSAIVQLRKVQNDFPHLFNNGKYVGEKVHDRQHDNGINRDTNNVRV